MKKTQSQHIIIAPDSFKGSLSSEAAASAIAKGIQRALPDAQITKIPIADGGEGTLDCMLASAGGNKVPVTVCDPLGKRIEAEFGILESQKSSDAHAKAHAPIAIIEMAKASGLGLVPDAQRDPRRTSTYGTGELIRAALDKGCRQFILALGGSATNDGGAGMLQALGMRLMDQHGNEVDRGGGHLGQICSIDRTNFDPRIHESKFIIASDVQNPLVGPQGATHIFGAQKGATPDIIDQLESNMLHWADLIERETREFACMMHLVRVPLEE